MKHRLTILIGLSIAAMLFSCQKKDDKPVDISNNPTDSVGTPLNGKIAGKDWEFIQGNAATNYAGDGKMLISLYPISFEDSCQIGHEADEVFLTIKPEEGKFDLNLDLNDWDKSLTVTLFDYETVNNFIAVDGYVELTSVDVSQGIITGKMDVMYDDSNYVKGSFQVPICDDFSY